MFRPFIRWTALALGIGALSGSASALFLYLLQQVTELREAHRWLIFLLPFTGFLVGLAYWKFGKRSDLGNNLLIDEYHESKGPIPFRMTPLVLMGSILTHLSGGSAGREGTAIQMAASLADQFTRFFKLTHKTRQIVLLTGFSAGFGSVFGTPIAGTVFAFEFVTLGTVLRPNALYPVLLAALVGDAVTMAWGITHHPFSAGIVPDLGLSAILYTAIAGAVFGLVARLFSKITHSISEMCRNKISFPPMRPFIGGCLFLVFFGWPVMAKYQGMGDATIQTAFQSPLELYDWLGKLLATGLTVGSGFRGGEVTPLFYMGATMGNALSTLIPLPLPMLAALGFVAVFAGAANAPLACTVMALELFGTRIGSFAALACVISFLCSGQTGIYSGQRGLAQKSSDLSQDAPEDIFRF